MKNIFLKTKKNSGYAILFTMLIASAISVITAGITNMVYKQILLSSLAKSSQSAFYQADTGAECAMYADFILTANNPSLFINGGSFDCGLSSLDVIPNGSNSYEIIPVNPSSNNPCFRIYAEWQNITDADGVITTETNISSKGYNICNLNNSKVVEREVNIRYKN